MRKILIAYATKCGSTGETARAIGRILGDAGYVVDLQPAREVRNLKGYDALVLGTAIRMGKPIGEARRFVRKHGKEMKRLAVAYFSLGLGPTKNSDEAHQESLGFLASLRSVHQPQVEAVFAGVLDFDKLPSWWRKMAAMDKEGTMVEGDFRDWDEINAWAAGLPAQLGL